MKLAIAIGGALALFCSSASADNVKTLAELAMLPSYCRGVFQVRDISRDPIPLSQYMQMYGDSYAHLHHYCWALNAENKADATFNRKARDDILIGALRDIQYVLTNSSPDFVFLPDVYNSRARMLFNLHRDSEAVLSLEKAIELKPGYVPAIARLSDYYAGIGDKKLAIQTLETGIENTEKADFLIGKLSKLGVTYNGTPGSAIKKEEQKDSQPPVHDASAVEPATPAASSVPAASPPANNSYCRFCP